MPRPREYDYEAEAELLLEWSLKDDSISLYAFTDDKLYLAQDLTDFAKRCPKFAFALKKAKNRIVVRREKRLNSGDLNQAAWNRSASLYDRMLHDHEENIKDSDTKREMKRDENREKIKAEAIAKYGSPPGDSDMSVLIKHLKSNPIKTPDEPKPQADSELPASDQAL